MMSGKGLGRWLVLAGVLALVAFAAWRLLGPPVVTVATPQRGPAIQAVYATGTVEPSVEVRIAPRVAGRLVELRTDEGRRVKAGDIMARLEDNDLASSMAQLEARATYARQQHERIARLFQQGWSTRAALDSARAERDAARAAVEQARAQRGYMWLKAPADGLVIRRDGEVGDFIPVNQPIFFMACCAPLRIAAEVDEEDIPLIRVGQKVLIRADAFPDAVYDGVVKEVTPRGDSTARSYRVRITFGADVPLQIGMTAETNVIVAERANALLVPASAVADNAVWLVQDGRLTRRKVTLGARGDDNVEVREGLKGDEALVLTPTDTLREGQRVRIETALKNGTETNARAG